ncbi:MAG: CehA/McbA family metallohydrolase [Chitinispirillaceae bacterium]|nr:CehA/McbA family metallohydrolase [Chitinispirillaceae bacterium]
MPVPPDLLSIPLVMLYAETHFRFFRFFPSLLFKRQPEILFDLPKRLDPSAPDLPVILIANDIDRFPITLSECSIAVSCASQKPKRFDFPDVTQLAVDHPLRKSMLVCLLRIPRNELPSGLLHVTAKVTVTTGKSRRIVLNDNFPGTPKYPFSCYRADERLPGSDICSYGDLHVHSLYSQSHVEFGPPISIIDLMTRANGLDFCAVTDHSYDLASGIDNYLSPDPGLSRWRLFLEEFSKNSDFQSIMIPGEEVSCLNKNGEVVHLCGLNLHDFIPGNLDGARKGRSHDLQLSLADAIANIHSQGGVAVAAHPGARVGFMQRLFLQRGNWSMGDLRKRLDGMQIMNSGVSPLLEYGKALWIKILLQGHKVPLLAGNDAHGDFNRYRAITTPFVNISDRLDRFFGNGKTGIYGQPRCIPDVLDAIRQGKTFITTGPFISMSVSGSLTGDQVISHSPISPEINRIFVHAYSTAEFGTVREVRVLAGKKGDDRETVVFSRNYANEKRFSVDAEIDLNALISDMIYLRAEVTCASPQKFPSAAFSSPVYWG